MKKIILLLSTVLFAAKSFASPVIYYQEGFTDNLWTFDVTTGTSTFVGDMGISQDSMGLTFDAMGDLYGFDRSSQSLYSIDQTTALATLIGASSIGAEDLTSDLNGGFYATFGGLLYSINGSTGAASAIGNLGAGTMDGLSVNPLTGELWGVDSGSMYTIDTTTGLATFIGSSVASETIAFASDGTLYTHDSNGTFYSLDTTTFSETVLGTTSFDLVFASAVAPSVTPPNDVPAPNVLLMLLCSISGWAAIKRIKR